MSLTATTPAPGLASAASRALRWSFLNTLASKVSTMAIGILLARLLGPAEFGTFAVATVALTAVLSCNELGVSLAIVRWKEDPAVIAPTVATLSIISSTLMTGALVLAAPWFCETMGAPDATPVVRLMAVSILLSGVVATPAALMQREFRQRPRTLVDQASIWVGALCSLVLVLTGWGAISLAIGRVLGATVGAVLFAVLAPQGYRLGFRRSILRPLLAFGLPLAGASILVFAVGYVDQLIVGGTLGATTLSYYVLAFNLASWPVIIFSLPLRGVAPALFARLRGDNGATRREFRRLLALLMTASLPVCAFLAGAADPVVRFVYGVSWAPAGQALRILAIVAAGRIFAELAYDFLVINGRSRVILAIQAVWLVALVPALLLSSHHLGLVGVAGAQLVVVVILVLPLYTGALRRSGLQSGDVLRPLLLPAVLAVAVGLVSAVTARQVHSPLLACLIAGAVAALTAGAMIWRQRSALSGLAAKEVV